MKIVSLGEVLWDVIGDSEHLGGAPFNFSAHATRLGHEVYFVSAVGCDERGDRVLERMAQMKLSARFVRRVESFPTGTAAVTLDLRGQPSFCIEHPAAYDSPELTAAGLEDLFSPAPDWIFLGRWPRRAREYVKLPIVCWRPRAAPGASMILIFVRPATHRTSSVI